MFIDDILQKVNDFSNSFSDIILTKVESPKELYQPFFFSDGIKYECLLKHFHSFATPAD